MSTACESVPSHAESNGYLSRKKAKLEGSVEKAVLLPEPPPSGLGLIPQR